MSTVGSNLDLHGYLLKTKGLAIRFGPFVVQFNLKVPRLVRDCLDLYRNFPVSSTAQFVDFRIAVNFPFSVRRWWRPKAFFKCEGRPGPFQPFPADGAMPFLEWGINWCIASKAHQYLLFHAAVLEKNGRAAVLPATPGSGKSTLAAAMACRGWRFLSDEFTMVRPGVLEFLPLPRLIPLKNESIEIMKSYAPDAHFGPLFPETRKGDVVHMVPPAESISQMDKTAEPALIIFPKYQSETDLMLDEVSKPRAAMRLAGNSFNYEVLGADGFASVCDIVDASDCYTLQYNNLDRAIQCIDQLHANL